MPGSALDPHCSSQPATAGVPATYPQQAQHLVHGQDLQPDNLHQSPEKQKNPGEHLGILCAAGHGPVDLQQQVRLSVQDQAEPEEEPGAKRTI